MFVALDGQSVGAVFIAMMLVSLASASASLRLHHGWLWLAIATSIPVSLLAFLMFTLLGVAWWAAVQILWLVAIFKRDEPTESPLPELPSEST